MDSQHMGNGSTGVKNTHGWQQVTNVKKQRRQESKDVKKNGKDTKTVSATVPNGSSNADGSLFSALDDASEQRRARIAAERVRRVEDEDSELEAGDVEHDEEDEEGRVGAQENQAEGDEKKVKPKKLKKPKVTPADAAAAINPADLSSFLAQISDSFAELPDVQLMRCADYFARAFSAVTTAHFSFQKVLRDSPLPRAVEVPLCYVPEPVVSTAGDWLSNQPAEELGKFILVLLRAVLEDTQKKNGAAVAPKAKVGILVVLGILLRKRPDVMLEQSDNIRNDKDFQGHEKLPTISWAFGQVAQADLISGMYLWVRNLLPLAVGKQGTPLTRDVALSFFESILCKNLAKARSTLVNGASKRGERLVTPAALNDMLHAAFPHDSAKTKATERFAAAYPLVKEVALAGSFRSKNTKPAALQLFPMSLTAAGEEPPALSEEACGNLVWCLGQNTDCYKQWEKHHIEQLHASTRALGYMVRNWQQVKGSLVQSDVLRKTIVSFRKKHQQLLKDVASPVSKEEVKRADRYCQSLLAKLSYFPSCLKASATLVVGAAVAYGLFKLGPGENPWGWDGNIILSRTHPIF